MDKEQDVPYLRTNADPRERIAGDENFNGVRSQSRLRKRFPDDDSSRRTCTRMPCRKKSSRNSDEVW